MSPRKSLAWSYGGQAFIFLQTFAVSVIVARILGPYDMGIFAVGAATAGVISVMGSFSVGAYLVRHPAPDAVLRTTAFTVNALLNVLVSAVIIVVALLGPRFGMISPVQKVLTLLAIAPLISIFEFLPSTFMQREMSFKHISVIAMCRAVINSAVLLPMAWTGWGYLSIAVATLAASLFTAVAYNVVARVHTSLRLGLQGWRDVTKFGMQMMSIGGLAAMMQRMSELVLGHFLGLAALGIYSRASSLASQMWENVYGLSTRVIFSQMAKEQREQGTVRNTYIHGLALLMAAIAPLFVGIAVLSGPLVQTLYGERWIAAASPLSLLMLAWVVGMAFSMNWELCVLRHRTAWQARNEGIRAVVGLLAFSLGASINVAAAAAGRLVELLCGFVLYGPKMREMAGTERGQILHVYRQSALLTLAAVGPVAGLMLANGWSPHTAWGQIGMAIATGVLLWLALLRSQRHPLLDEMMRIARRALDASGIGKY